ARHDEVDEEDLDQQRRRSDDLDGGGQRPGEDPVGHAQDGDREAQHRRDREPDQRRLYRDDGGGCQHRKDLRRVAPAPEHQITRPGVTPRAAPRSSRRMPKVTVSDITRYMSRTRLKTAAVFNVIWLTCWALNARSAIVTSETSAVALISSMN